MRVKSTAALAGWCGALIAVMGGCGENSEDGRDSRLNVILISMDTTRADHLSCYGHPVLKTPNIDRLAAEGVRFEKCIASAPITLPSHSSMMTGTHPFVHQVRDNGTFRLHDDNQTLAEVLFDQGYRTAAQVGAFVMNHSFGLDQGFGIYRYVGASRALSAAGMAVSEIDAEHVTEGAIELLREIGSEPFFLFVHYFDPHQPYAPPERFGDQYYDPYMGEIAYVDEQIGRLIEELARQGLDQNTLIVLTADHGESLGQHGEATHAFFVYDTTLRVPLIFRCPGLVPCGATVDSLVRSIDIAPTILRLVGAPPLTHAQGIDLSPAWETPEVELKLEAYSETFYTRYNLGYSQLRSLHADGWKFILAPTPELYHLREDPAEARNAAGAWPERVEAMRARLRTLIETGPRVVQAGSARRQADEEDLRRLAALGYVSGGVEEEDSGSSDDEMAMFEPKGPNPMERKREIHLVSQAVALTQTHQYARIEKTLRELLSLFGEDSRRFVWAHTHLAGALAAQGKMEEALRHFDFAIAARPDDGQLHSMKGLVLRAMQRDEEALQTFRIAVALEPVFASRHMQLGDLLLKLEKPAEAEAQYRLAIDKDIGLARAYIGLAKTLRATNRVGEVLQLLEKNIAELEGAGDHERAGQLREVGKEE